MVFDCLLQRKNSPNLLVTFSGALAPGKRASVTFPIFSGTGIAKDLNCSVLSIADPTLVLSRDLSLAWYAGCLGLNLPALIVSVVQHISNSLGTSSIFLLGGSGGGFAALNTSLRLPQSTVICMNPQTNIAAYYKNFTSQFSKACFGRTNFELVPNEHKVRHRTNLLNLYKKNHNNNIFYLQNLSDSHLQTHAIPFSRALEYDQEIMTAQTGIYNLTDKAILIVGNWGKGHIPTPKIRLHHLLSKVFKNPREAKEILQENNEWLIN